MGSSEMDKAGKEKESKTPPTTTQEQSSTTSAGTVNPDWSGFQAYSPIPPHGFLASSPQAHPYMWGVQVSFVFPLYIPVVSQVSLVKKSSLKLKFEPAGIDGEEEEQQGFLGIENLESKRKEMI
ncbi:bZIP transcription factor 68 [Vitis vinifera]|uniref:BZIP transcription factor 68 n=1 Tax=Vitis vinifera TaxID=29760 RepID=A0A438CBG8_VITVI|nr:bZIP transcription factor 68 [Vitis vinifera]RVW72716.1 bZIP transcription factor 68 [Vitis vinifera]